MASVRQKYRFTLLVLLFSAVALLLADISVEGARQRQKEDRYLIEGKIRSESHGDVYRVKDIQSRQLFAMKISKSKAKAVASVKNEAEMLRAASRPSANDVVQLYDEFPCFSNQYCLILETASNDLSAIAQQIKRNSWSERLATIKKVSQDIMPVLIRLSAKDIVHANIRLASILYYSTTNSYKLADFAASIKQGNHRVHNIRKASIYNSPEILAYNQYSHASDMWSFGETLLNLFVGINVFQPDESIEKPRFNFLKPSSEVIIKKGIVRQWQEWLDPLPPKLATDLKTASFTVPPESTNQTAGKLHQKLRERLSDFTDVHFGHPKFQELMTFSDFLAQCFHYDPKQRMTALKAERHSFMTGKKLVNRLPGILEDAEWMQ